MLETAEIGSSTDKATFDAESPGLRVDLINAQFDLAGAGFPVLIIIDGDDRWGCEQLIDRVLAWMDARRIDTHVFETPTDAESRRPRLWRYWHALPPKGRIGLFLGAYPMVAVRSLALGRIDRAEYDRRLAHDRLFETTLADDATLILKFYLHLPEDEARRRLERAEKHPDRYWYVHPRDHKLLKARADTMPVVEDYLARTSDPHAPWRVVESTDERHRDLTVMRTIRDALTARLAAPAGPRPPAPPAVPAPDALATIDLDARAGDSYHDDLERLQARINKRSRKAREAGLATIVCLEGWDAAGKGGVIRRLTAALDARNYTVVSTGPPDDNERRFHYLWRFWQRVPAAGRIAIFDRSWYGRLLVERVEALASPDEWARADAEIRDFEAQLVEHGIILLKFWLHISPDEQQRRFHARADTPYKKYKLTDDDRRNRARRDDYTAAANDMIARTSTPEAPWRLVAADDKRHARLTVLGAVADALKSRL